jgi:hypothetical protein
MNSLLFLLALLFAITQAAPVKSSDLTRATQLPPLPGIDTPADPSRPTLERTAGTIGLATGLAPAVVPTKKAAGPYVPDKSEEHEWLVEAAGWNPTRREVKGSMA